MTGRSIVTVILFSALTFGLYSLYWMISTKDELNRHGAQIPTALLMFIPFVNF